jgi:hypothetical protein
MRLGGIDTPCARAVFSLSVSLSLSLFLFFCIYLDDAPRVQYGSNPMPTLNWMMTADFYF